MLTLILNLWNDDAGFVISAELVLICTMAVLAMVVGLTEVSYGINQELEDTGTAFGTFNQSYRYSGLTGHSGGSSGSTFQDLVDSCDAAGDVAGSAPRPES